MERIPLRKKILETIVSKSTLKQKVFDNTFATFNDLKETLLEMASEMDDQLDGLLDRRVRLEYRDRGKFEAQTQQLLIFPRFEKLADLPGRQLPTDMQFKILDSHPHGIHLLRKTQPIAPVTHHVLRRDRRSIPFLADKQSFENQLVDGLPKRIARYVHLTGKFDFIGQQFPLPVFFL